MIERLRHKGLERLYVRNDARGVNPQHVEKITLILTLLDAAETIEAMNVPSLRLHKLAGNRAEFWSVTVRANWLIIFRFENGNAFDIDLIDYH